MAAYIAAATTTVDDSSTVILAANANEGVVVEVSTTDAAIWVHITGGTAAASAVDCIPIPKDSGTVFHLPTGHNGLTAIRVGATDAEVTVATQGG